VSFDEDARSLSPEIGIKERLLHDEPLSEHHKRSQRPSLESLKRYGVVIITTLNLLVLAAILFVLLAKNSANKYVGPYKTDRNIVIKESTYYCKATFFSINIVLPSTANTSAAPFLDRLDVPIKDIKVNGFLLDLNEPESLYRQDPSPEVDEEWKRIQKFEYMLITADDVRRLGKDPKYTVKAPESFGAGSDLYIARTEVSHQIHCLDVLRKASFPDYYAKTRDGVKESIPLWRPHVMHCLHILLQNLMCTASMDVITYNWMESQYSPQPDFSINRQCRDFDAILRWQDENKVPDGLKKMKEFVKEGGSFDAPRVPIPQKYLDLFANGTVLHDD